MRVISVTFIIFLLASCATNSSQQSEEAWDVIIYANLTTIKAEKYSNFPPPSYTLIFNVTNGSIKVYKKYINGIVEELSFPSDTFENFGKDNPLRRHESIKRLKLVFNVTPDVIAWDGRYYLMANGYSIIKYDGEKFTVYRILEHPYTPIDFNQIIPLGDECWILTFIDKGTPLAGVMIYDSKKGNMVDNFEFDWNSSTVVKIKKLNDCNVNISASGELFRW